LLAGQGWCSELLRRPRRFMVRADTKSRSGFEPRKSSPDLDCSSASVGRKSGAPSAAPKARAYSRYAGLSPQSGSGRNLLLYSEPARPRCGSIGDANRHIAQRGSRVRARHALAHRRLGCPPRSSALPADLATRRCRLPRSVARNQNRICEVFAYRRVAIAGDDQPRRTGHLAASVLGAHDTRRSGLCGSHGRHAFQPGETRSRGAPGGLAAFVVSSVPGWRTVSRRVARRQ
jgi:hypothetical protein